MRLSITMLGAFEVLIDGVAIPPATWKLRHPRELLQMVALHPGHRLPRQHAVEALWPDAEPQAASNRLYHTAHLIRSVFVKAGVPKAEPVLLLSADSLQLNPALDLSVDVGEFRALIERSRRGADPRELNQAITLYQGELLSGFACADWMAPHRESCRLDHVWALRRLAGQHHEAADFEHAIGLYQKLLDAEPADELAHRALMELFDLTQHPERAVYQFAACKQALQRDLDVAPSPATVAVLDRIVDAAQQSKSGTTAAPAPLVPPATPRAATRYLAPAHAVEMHGRSDDLATLCTWLTCESTRLLTITGAAGLGKTRLAHAVLEQCQGEFDAGVAVVALTHLSAEQQLAEELGAVLCLAPSQQRPMDRLIAHLRKRKLLLLLDRFEHIVGAGPVLSELLAAAPGLVILVTSQVPLGLPQERVYRLPSLVARGTEDAVRLFCHVASNLNCPIKQPDDLALVASICVGLGGNALAIHLAARQAQVLSLPQMVRELKQPLELLVTTLRDVEPHHRSLRHAIAWAHSLLDPRNRRLFALLGAFRSTFSTDDAVEALAGFMPRETLRAGLADLVERHLVSTVGAAPHLPVPPRLVLLDSLAQFARDKLEESNEGAAVDAAHARHFTHRAEHFRGRIEQGGSKDAIAFFHDDRNNVLAALAWLDAHAAAVDCLGAALSIASVAMVAGATSDAVTILQAALDKRLEASPEERRLSAWCAYKLARAYAWRANQQTDAAIRTARRLSETCNDQVLRDKIVTHLANDRMNRGKYRVAVAFLMPLIQRHEQSGDSLGLVGNYGLLAGAQHALGQGKAALASADAAVRHARAAQRPPMFAYALMIQCETRLQAGDVPSARETMAAILELPRTGLSVLRDLHCRLLECFIEFEATEFALAEQKLREILGSVKSRDRAHSRAFSEILCDLIAIETCRFDRVTTIDSLNVASLPRNPAYADMGVRLLCGRVRLFAARGDWHKTSNSLKQLLDQMERTKNHVWCAWAFEACAMALVGRCAPLDCTRLLALSKLCLSIAQVAPTPRQQKNWDQIERSAGRSEARETRQVLGESAEFDPACEPMSAHRALWLLRHEVLESMFTPVVVACS